MQISRWITTVDTHTEGEPTRIVTGGLAPLHGKTVTEKMRFFQNELDVIRTSLLWEPRGHRDMYGCVLTTPSVASASAAIFFMDGEGYMDMCGHGTIGVSTALVELGMVTVEEPVTCLQLETPAGVVDVEVKVADGRAVEVSFQNVPAYVRERDVLLNVPDLGMLEIDVAYGGNHFAFFSAAAAGLELTPARSAQVTEVGMRVLEAVRNRFSPPVNIVTAISKPKDARNKYRNVHVFGRGQFDRSPGGTGTSARLAVLHSRGEIGVGEEIRVESLTGGVFRGRIDELMNLNGRSEVSTKIVGAAHITGLHQWVLDSSDPLHEGFSLE